MSDHDVAFARLDSESGERFQRLGRELGVSALGINLIVLEPRQRLRVHLHEQQEEIYLVLSGELTLTIEGDERVLRSGDLARVGPKVRRQLLNRGSGRVEILAVGGSGDHVSRDARAWASWDEPGEGRQPQDVPLPDDLSA